MRTRAARPGPWWCLLGALALSASCTGTSTGPEGTGGMVGSGGKPASGGAVGTGGKAASGGGPSTGGATTGGTSTDLGGQAGAAGASALPPCGCTEGAAITVEFPEGTHIYDRIAEHGDSCNRLRCEPEAAYAIYRGAPPNRYSLSACDADGECVLIESGALGDATVEGTVTVETNGEVRLSEAALVDALAVLDVPGVEFTFETTSGQVHGSGHLCWAPSNYICLK